MTYLQRLFINNVDYVTCDRPSTIKYSSGCFVTISSHTKTIMQNTQYNDTAYCKRICAYRTIYDKTRELWFPFTLRHQHQQHQHQHHL